MTQSRIEEQFKVHRIDQRG